MPGGESLFWLPRGWLAFFAFHPYRQAADEATEGQDKRDRGRGREPDTQGNDGHE